MYVCLQPVGQWGPQNGQNALYFGQGTSKMTPLGQDYPPNLPSRPYLDPPSVGGLGAADAMWASLGGKKPE